MNIKIIKRDDIFRKSNYSHLYEMIDELARYSTLEAVEVEVEVDEEEHLETFKSLAEEYIKVHKVLKEYNSVCIIEYNKLYIYLRDK